MTKEEIQQRAERFFKMLEDAGITKCIVVEPPSGGAHVGEIKNGEILVEDRRDGTKKPIVLTK